jgi:cytochrome P450 monooxygenase
VAVSLHNLSRNPERYPDPDRFLPERWLARDKKPGPLETAQFGGGPHFCLGYHVAWLEAVLFLVCVARTFGARGTAPVTVGGALPQPSYVPLQRPPKTARVRFERA